MSSSSTSSVLAAALAVLLQPMAVAAQDFSVQTSSDEPLLETAVEPDGEISAPQPSQVDDSDFRSPALEVEIEDPFSGGDQEIEAGTSEQLVEAESSQVQEVIPESLLPPWELDVQANRQWFDTGLQRFVAVGDVELLVANGRLQADRVEYSPANRVIWARGSVRFQRGKQYLQASLLRFNLLQGEGELQDVYGVIDLTSLGVDFNPDAPLAGTLEAEQAQKLQRLRLLANQSSRSQQAPRDVVVESLPEPMQMACPPLLPAQVSRLPGPWAITAWGGQMTDATFGETFLFSGAARPEGIFGLGFNRRLIDADPFAIELDGNALFHSAFDNRRLRYVGGVPKDQRDQAITRAQDFWEGTIGIGLRWWIQPWLSFGVVEGVSMNSAISNYEKVSWSNSTQFLNYLAAEISAQITPQWSLVGRIHHRSGAYGTYDGVAEGSNGYLVGIRYNFGDSPAAQPQEANHPPLGCPDPDRDSRRPRLPLEEQLEAVVFDGPQAQIAPALSEKEGPPISIDPGAQLEERREAIAQLDQRVRDVRPRAGVKFERRLGAGDFAAQSLNPAQQQFDLAESEADQELQASRNDDLITGEVTHWRIQAPSLRLLPDGWTAPRLSMTNDPFTPAQAWVDMNAVRSWEEPDGTTVIRGSRNRLLLENRLPIPLQDEFRFTPEEENEFSNRWSLKVDQEDRDGFYLEYNLPKIEAAGARLDIRPQFMLERAIDGWTDSYPLPGASAGSQDVIQPAYTSDMFGLNATLDAGLGEKAIARARLDLSSLNPQNLSNATRTNGDIAIPFKVRYVGDVLARVYGAYRYRVWNGSLGKQDIYAAFGGSLQSTGNWPTYGPLSTSYVWTLGLGNYKATAFKSAEFDQLWRLNAYGALRFNLQLWEGRSLPLTSEGAYRYSSTPVVPGLSFGIAPYVSSTAYGDGLTQNYVGVSGGPELTLGHFNRSMFDYTKFRISASSTAIIDQSPFSFDRFVDGATIGFGLDQQLIGPVVLRASISYNIDGESGYFGEVTSSYFELKWQRRAYEFGFYYSPYTGIGGFRIRLNDFGFRGTGLPFVPYNPSAQAQEEGPPGLPMGLDYMNSP